VEGKDTNLSNAGPVLVTHIPPQHNLGGLGGDVETVGAPRPRRRFVLLAAVVLLLIAALVLPPLINISRYQRQIAASLAASLGHPVEVSGITLLLLPRPGVQIANFIVDSAPGYSAEPILQCSSVTAGIRLSSLWRGRLEIARISLDEPSLNLERAANGQWNFASVLLQASRTPQAPTGRTTSRGQNRFPYIEVHNARINFKHGAEKLPFSFMNANASVWLENPDEWQLRFDAQPMRTDINLSLADTGQIQVSGSVRRASTASELPLDLQAEWRGAPLGQATRMLFARDLGWRGSTRISAHLAGVPGALGVRLTAEATDFHRETFEPAQPLNLDATCTATYRHWQGSVDDLHCLSPIGEGSVHLSGTIHQIHAFAPEPDLKFTVTHIPVGSFLEFLRHTRGRLNSDLTASGSLVASNLLVRNGGLEQLLPDLRFTAQPSSQPFALALEPAHVDLGGPQPLLASARLTRQGYLIRYSGSALLTHLLPLVEAFRIVPAGLEGLQGTGTADYNLTVQGDWIVPFTDSHQSAPLSTVDGSFSLHDADFQPSYLAEPVHVVTATATLSPAELRWNGISAIIGATHFMGSMRIPLPCVACQRHFDLTAANVSLGALGASLRGEDEGIVQELLNRVRSRSRDWPPLEGTVHIAHLTLGRVEIANAGANIAVYDGNLEVQALDGRTLGGTLHATGAVDLGSTPSYDAEIQLRRISAPDLAALLNERWGPGQLDISADLMMNGTSGSNLSDSAKGMLHWDWTSGALPQLTSTPFHRFDRWTANGKVVKGEITLTSSEITSNNTTATVTGTVASDRSLNLKIGTPPESETATTAPLISMTGTLAAPVAERP
jgi:AsmA family/AsmA-like C-terminal region